MIEFDLEIPEIAGESETTYAVNRELNLAWDIIENTGANLFLTGRAGTGKTTFLKKLREISPKRMIVLAPTGVAAINASGITIHSFFQLPFSPFIPGKGFLTEDKKYLNISKEKKRLVSSLSLLVIDEISMVRPDTLDAIDSILRRLRNSSLPFGGLQLLLIGDLRQLPPVIREGEWDILKDHYSSPYFYESHALKDAGYQTVELSVIYRQEDRLFIDILNKIRSGNIDREALSQLNSRCVSSGNFNEEEGYIRLTTHNNRASVINKSRLNALSTPEFTFEAEVKDNFPESSFPVDRVLHLKEGAQVMFMKNDVGEFRRFYNGMIGKIVSLSDEMILVKPQNGGEIIEVERVEWENIRYAINEETKAVVQEKIGSFIQYPLQLAWAITIHKSQGLTFEKAIIDASHSFAPGQTYVALSRCRSLEGLFLDSPIYSHAVITDRVVNDFVAYCESNTPDEERMANLKNKYIFTLLSELFDFEPLRRNYADFMRYAGEYLLPVYPEIETDLKDYQQEIEDRICEVARKFIDSCQKKYVEALSRYDSRLNERISKGCTYFLNLLSDLGNFLQTIPIDIDNRQYVSRLESLLDSLLYDMELKKHILTSISETNFSISSYLDAKACAILTLEQPDTIRKKNKPKSKKAVKEPKKKKPKGYSTFETLRLFREGKTIPEIAVERQFTEGTIGGHIADLIALDRIKIEEIVDTETLQLIKNEIKDSSDLSYSEFLEKINSIKIDNPIPTYIVNICYRLFRNSKNNSYVKVPDNDDYTEKY